MFEGRGAIRGLFYWIGLFRRRGWRRVLVAVVVLLRRRIAVVNEALPAHQVRGAHGDVRVELLVDELVGGQQARAGVDQARAVKTPAQVVVVDVVQRAREVV